MATGFNTQTGGGEYRLQFETTNKEYFLLMQETARRCVDHKPKTNADRIRAMSDEGLAEFFAPQKPTSGFPWCKPVGKVRCGKPSCHKCALAWLQQPAEEVDHE